MSYNLDCLNVNTTDIDITLANIFMLKNANSEDIFISFSKTEETTEDFNFTYNDFFKNIIDYFDTAKLNIKINPSNTYFKNLPYYGYITDDNITSNTDLITAVYDVVINKINRFINMRGNAYYNLYQALYSIYNPINNYDKNSTITTTYKGTEIDTLSKTGTETDTMTKGGTETTTKSGAETDTLTHTPNEYSSVRSETSDDNTTYKGVEKTTESGTYTDTDTKTFNNRSDSLTFTDRTDTNTRSFNNRTDINTKTFNNRSNVVNEYTSGNIGVTTTQQMILSQFNLTDLDNLKMYITSDIINSVCHY